jgi:hypothetical protein
VVHPKLPDSAKGLLNSDQVVKLRKLLDEQYEITSKDGKLSFTVSMADILRRLVIVNL